MFNYVSGEVPCMFYNPRIGCYAHTLGYFHLLEVPRRIFDGHNNGHWTFFPTQRALPKEIFTCDMRVMSYSTKFFLSYVV